MEKWAGKVAVVTGASSGIGAAIVKELAKSGVTVVGLARRQEKVQEIAELLDNEPGKIYAIKTDITIDDDIQYAFDWIQKNLGGVDILVNNAGVAFNTLIKDGKTESWRKMFDVNVIALGNCIRETLNSLRERGIDDGHIININSVAGHRMSRILGNNVYSSTKFAARILTEGLRLELAEAKSKIRVTNISPGFTATEIFEVGGWAKLIRKDMPTLQPKSVAETVIFALKAPPEVLVGEMIVRPTGEGP